MSPVAITLFLLLIGSFIASLIIIPRIRGVVAYKALMDVPDKRSSHSMKTPSLGGITFYITLVLGLFFLHPWDFNAIALSLVSGLLVLFIIGLKDDLVVLSPVTKIGAQLMAIGFVLWNPVFHITALNGFLGIETISLWLAIPLSIFIMLTIINAYNLIDGIDGLASTIGVIIFSMFGILFYYLKMPLFMGIGVVMIGSFLAFLRYNLSTNKKIFMGDTGSLVIGFMIAVMTIRLFAISPSKLSELPFMLENLPIVVLAILFVPFFDTARVFTIRVLKKDKPFSPDRNHVHHLLIDYLHLSHRKASFFIGCVNGCIIVLFFFLANNLNNFILLGIMAGVISLFGFSFYKLYCNRKKIAKRMLERRKKAKRLNIPQIKN